MKEFQKRLKKKFEEFNDKGSPTGLPLNEIKKLLYREKPIAIQQPRCRCGRTFYHARTSKGTVYFTVSNKESRDLRDREPAQLMIRWLSKKQKFHSK